MAIDLKKLEVMLDTLFSDEAIEEKFWDWYTNRNKNISQTPVSGELPPISSIDKDILRDFFNAGYDFRSSMQDDIKSEFGENSSPNFEQFYKERITE